VLKNKEKAQKEYTLTISKQLGATFSREKHATIRLREESEYNQKTMGEKSQHKRDVMGKKILMDKNLGQQMKEVEMRS